jgi:hypothetical protein
MSKGSDLLVAALENEGVEYVFASRVKRTGPVPLATGRRDGMLLV